MDPELEEGEIQGAGTSDANQNVNASDGPMLGSTALQLGVGAVGLMRQDHAATIAAAQRQSVAKEYRRRVQAVLDERRPITAFDEHLILGSLKKTDKPSERTQRIMAAGTSRFDKVMDQMTVPTARDRFAIEGGAAVPRQHMTVSQYGSFLGTGGNTGAKEGLYGTTPTLDRELLYDLAGTDAGGRRNIMRHGIG